MTPDNNREEQLDRFARGELSPAESRELARQSLDDPQLFDDLTATATARTALSRAKAPPPRARWVMPAIAAAAVVMLASGAYVLTHHPPPPAPPVAPILLSQNTAASLFRGGDADTRAARTSGSVTEVEEMVVSIDLGSIDGLSAGNEVELFRNGLPTGTLKLTTIFRDNARGLAPHDVTVHEKDEVRVPRQILVRAALDQIDALAAHGDAEAASHLAAQTTLGAADPSSMTSIDWNNLGVIAELHGDRPKAKSAYEHALTQDPSPQARQSIELNLARVKGSK